MASSDVQPDAEVLSFGPRPVRVRSWRPLVIAAVAALVVAAVLAVLALRPQPPRDFTFSDLQDVYAGMVRADGTNDAATLDKSQPRRPPAVAVAPSTCLPLVETTLAEQFPAKALDGVSTYWLGETSASAVSLFTLRYPNRAAATSEYQAIADALAACDGQQLMIGRDSGLVTATPVSYENGVQSQLGYLVKLATGDLYAISVMQYANTISWQFRLEIGSQPYQPFVAQRLMDSLVAQVRSIEDLRR
jgi:hypothetical protein